MLTRSTPLILTVAGFDPSAGAGVLADIKTFEYCKVYGQAVCTALTVQNEEYCEKSNWLSWEEIKKQLEILFRIRNFEYIKIGLVENSKTLELIFKWLHRKTPKSFILWDPILKASSGFKFHRQNAISWQKLFSYVNLLTPNLPEAEFLGITKGSPKTAVLVKGGHYPATPLCTDSLFMPNSLHSPLKFTSKRINVQRHGSGCVLSALILANFAKCNDLEKSICLAKRVVQKIFTNGNGKLGMFF